MEFFRAPYDRLAVALTVVGLAIIGGAGLLFVLLPVPFLALRLGVPAACLVIILLTYRYSPCGYSVGPEGIRIHQGLGSTLLPLTSLRAVRRAGPGELCGLRTFGSGGLFGYFGWFWNRRFGHHLIYARSRHNLVLLEAGRVYLLSPDRPEEFIQRLREWRPDLADSAK